MTKILPHTERFILIFNKLKSEKKLPSNAKLATQIGLNSGNSITEITSKRQNIGLENIQKFCEKYGAANGFSIEDIMGGKNPFPINDGEDWERARAAAVEEQVAEIKSLVYGLMGKQRSYSECLDDIDTATTKILDRLRRSERRE